MASSGFASSGNFGSFSGSGNAGANSIYLTKVVLLNAATISAVLINVISSVSGIQYKAVIYDGSHSSLLGAGSVVTSLAAGYNRLPLAGNVSLVAGTYYVGYACNSTLSVTIAALTAGAWFVSGGQSVTAPANPLVGGSASNNALAIVLEFDGSTAQGYGWGADYSTGVTLSQSNSVGTTTAGGANIWEGMRGIVTHDTPGTGKFYAEVVPSATFGTATFIGVAAASINMANTGAATNG
ncbi:MAG TPA: hypothetical protein VGF36_09655, partial [Rhodopila sp.]